MRGSCAAWATIPGAPHANTPVCRYCISSFSGAALLPLVANSRDHERARCWLGSMSCMGQEMRQQKWSTGQSIPGRLRKRNRYPSWCFRRNTLLSYQAQCCKQPRITQPHLLPCTTVAGVSCLTRRLDHRCLTTTLPSRRPRTAPTTCASPHRHIYLLL